MTLNSVSQKLVNKKPPTYTEPREDTGAVFEQIVAYLEANPDKKHTLKSLSGKFFLAENYISNLFAKKMQTTVKKSERIRKDVRLGKQRYESKYMTIKYFYESKNWSINWMCNKLEISRAGYYK